MTAAAMKLESNGAAQGDALSPATKSAFAYVGALKELAADAAARVGEG
jgi:hypothetical protein